MLLNKNDISEEQGKKISIEVKKMIKANKEKQLPFNMINIDMIALMVGEGNY